MEIHFSWAKFNGRYYPGCHCIGDAGPYPYLGCLLNDDGGLGLNYHIPRLREGQKMCEHVLQRSSASECFTTECFAADISQDGVWIFSITEEPTSCVKYRLAGIACVLERWIEFLLAGFKEDAAPLVLHIDL